jgi:hypothetical protein
MTAQLLKLLKIGAFVTPFAYRIEDAAHLCSLSRWTLRRETKQGKLRCTPLGLYPAEELCRYLREQLVGPEEKSPVPKKRRPIKKPRQQSDDGIKNNGPLENKETMEKVQE